MKKLSLYILLIFFCSKIIGQSAEDNWVFHQQENDGWFSSILEDNYGKIIVGGGTPNSKFRVFDGINWTLYNLEDFNVDFGLFVKDMAINSENVLWLAQGNFNGLVTWDGNSLQNYNAFNSDISSDLIFGVGIGLDNIVWHSRFQSFDGEEWTNYALTCNSGTRKVHVSNSGDVWITGTTSIGIETGIIYQPCLHQISEDVVVNYHFENGDNVPELTGSYHLICELSDGAILVFGKTSNGIEVKKFNGIGWDDYDLFESNEVEMSGYYGIWKENDQSIWLCGSKDGNNAQLINYCEGEWLVYNLPETQGFSDIFYDILIDDGVLWAVGDGAICSVELAESNCVLSNIIEMENDNLLCHSATLNNQQLILGGCMKDDFSFKFQLFDNLGRIVRSGIIDSEKKMIGKLPAGLYFLQLIGLNENKKQTFKLLEK